MSSQGQIYTYIIHIDNLFTGLNLLSYLKYLGFGAVGMVRENRISRSCPLTNKKQFKKNLVDTSNILLKKKMVFYWSDGWTIQWSQLPLQMTASIHYHL